MGVQRYTQIMVVDTFSSLPTSAMDGDLAYLQDIKNTMVYNGASSQWIASARVVVKKSLVTVNGSTTGATLIYTLEASNQNFYPLQITVRPVNISGTTIKPTFSVGSNATSYDNIATGSLLNTVTTVTGVTTSPQNASTSPALAGGTNIFTNVTIAAVATSYTFRVEIVGFYDV